MSVCFVLSITIFICLQILQEDDKLWPQPDRVGRQVSVNVNISGPNDQKVSSKQVWLLNFFCCNFVFCREGFPCLFSPVLKNTLKTS